MKKLSLLIGGLLASGIAFASDANNRGFFAELENQVPVATGISPLWWIVAASVIAYLVYRYRKKLPALFN